jgi:dethiobiotin synthetase
VLVAGTGTGVGKTWIAVRVLEALRAEGRRVAARKPAQSGTPGEISDADLLAEATGEPGHEVCPLHRRYGLAMAPFMAAERLGLPSFTLADLVDELRWEPGVDLGVVEGAGGVRSPIASDGADTADLADALHPDLVVLVADAGLGTIHAVRTSLPAVDAHPTVVVLNRFDAADELHRMNHGWLASHLAVDVVVDDHMLAARLRSSS